MGYKDGGVHRLDISYPSHCRFDAIKPIYEWKFQKCQADSFPDQNHRDSGCMGVARLERGISTHILHPPLSALRSRKRRKTLPFARKGAVFRFQDRAKGVCSRRFVAF